MNSTSRPSVAVVIPAKNAGVYIEETIHSILGQALLPDEILLIDDGSTDNTAEIAKRFAASGVKTLAGPGKGAAAALNFGIASTRCELIAHFDADDLMLPAKLKMQVGLFGQPANAQLGLVSSDLRMFGPAGDDPRSFLEQRPLFHKRCGRDTIHLTSSQAMLALSHEHCIDVKGVYSRAAWQAVGGFNPAFRCAYDMDFVWRIAQRFAVAVIPEVLFRGRRHASNLSGREELVSSECIKVFRQMLANQANTQNHPVVRNRIRRELLDLGYMHRKQRAYWDSFKSYAAAYVGINGLHGLAG